MHASHISKSTYIRVIHTDTKEVLTKLSHAVALDAEVPEAAVRGGGEVVQVADGVVVHHEGLGLGRHDGRQCHQAWRRRRRRREGQGALTDKGGLLVSFLGFIRGLNLLLVASTSCKCRAIHAVHASAGGWKGGRLSFATKRYISIFSISNCDLCFGILDSQPRRQGENGFLNSVSYSESAVQEKPQRVGSLAKLNLKRNYLKQNRKKVIIHWSSILEAATSEKRYEFC